MYLCRHPERKIYLMFPMRDGIKRCLYTKLLVNCILFKALIAVVVLFLRGVSYGGCPHTF